MTKLRIGTRKSKLALKQTDLVISALKRVYPNLEYQIISIQTKGDQVHHKPLREICPEGKVAFTSELEKALEEDNIDIAVHSMKDVAGNIRLESLVFPAFLERVSPLDILLTNEEFSTIADLPDGFVVGTVSLRRQAGILRMNPKLDIKNLRGNIQTRIAKLRGAHKWKGHSKIDYDGIIMAEAAIQRSGAELDLSGLNIIKISEKEIIPPAGQGVIGIQCRATDNKTKKILDKINHSQTSLEITVERDFLYEMGGNCHSVIGVYCKLEGDEVSLIAEISEDNGENRFYIEDSINVADAKQFGSQKAKELKKNIVSKKGIEFLLRNLNVSN